MKMVVRATLQSAVHSPANRRMARELAWRWVAAKWPRLVPTPSDMERSNFERSLPGQALAVSTTEDGSAWSLSVAHTQRGTTRTWMTRAQVMATHDADVLTVQTACTDAPETPLVVAPPRLLADWVEGIDLQDAGLAVQGAPREVFDPWQLAALCEHLLSAQRRLPVIALVNRPQTRYYGVDPHGLAESLRGLAHVACIAPHLTGDISNRLGHDFGVVHGAARIYAAGFTPKASPAAHPLLRDASARSATRSDDPGAFRRMLSKRVCALSVHEAS
jgi:hypothetical protein